MRPAGTFAATASMASGPSELTGSSACGVRMTPGATAFAVDAVRAQLDRERLHGVRRVPLWPPCMVQSGALARPIPYPADRRRRDQSSESRHTHMRDRRTKKQRHTPCRSTFTTSFPGAIIEVLRCHLPCDPGVGDDDVHAAESARGFGDEGVDVRCVGDIDCFDHNAMASLRSRVADGFDVAPV